jgi:hypothetical protein
MDPHVVRVDLEPPLASAHSGTVMTVGIGARRGHREKNHRRCCSMREQTGRAPPRSHLIAVHPPIGGRAHRWGAMAAPSPSFDSLIGECCELAVAGLRLHYGVWEKGVRNRKWWALGFAPNQHRFWSSKKEARPLDEIGWSRFIGPAKLAQVANVFFGLGPPGGLEHGIVPSVKKKVVGQRFGLVLRDEQWRRKISFLFSNLQVISG